jgi:8-oxo-dGTP pyrophosphatase MutT (NUDIX family)
MADSQPQHRTACGFVLVRRKKGRFTYLTLVNRERGEAGLPKGHAEAGETERVTALRETEEETGLTDIQILGEFRRELHYQATRAGLTYPKTVVYFAARNREGSVVLSAEHASFAWLPLGEALTAIPHPNLRGVVRDAALFLKDPALFDLEPATEAEADAHLASLPEASDHLLAHLRGGAKLARAFAEALHEAGKPVHVEATATGTLLHDVGRALGRHDDHQRAGVRYLEGTPLAPYAFACISHFTKGASPEALIEAGVAEEVVRDFNRMTDMSRLTWEERCAARADACMKGAEPAPPEKRFADLRRRYDAPALITLQERLADGIRRKIAKALGHDPLTDVDLA